jgi:hypothetical protein
LVGVAVKVTEVPGQIGAEGFAEMDTSGVIFGLTAIVIALLLAEEGDAQVALETMVTLIRSPFAKVLEEYDELVAPDIFVQVVPSGLVCHW